MNLSYGELAMLSIAYDGELKATQMDNGIYKKSVVFVTEKLPEAIEEAICSDDYRFDITHDELSYGKVTICSYDMLGDTSFNKYSEMDTHSLLYDPDGVMWLWKNRWIIPNVTARCLSIDEYGKFMDNFENGFAKFCVDESYKDRTKRYEHDLFLRLNFIHAWSDGIFYEANEPLHRTIFRCNNNAILQNIDIKDDLLSIFDNDVESIISYDENSINIPIADIIYIQIDAVEIKNMLDKWYELEIWSDADDFFHDKDIIHDRQSMLYLNAFHEMIIKKAQKNQVLSENTEDEVLRAFLKLDELYNIGLFKKFGHVFRPLHLLNENSSDFRWFTLMDELAKISYKSNYFYFDTHGNLVTLTKLDNFIEANGLNAVLKHYYYAINKSFLNYYALEHFIADVSILKRFTDIEHKSCNVMQNKVKTIDLVNLVDAFVIYYIQKTMAASDDKLTELINVNGSSTLSDKIYMIDKYAVFAFIEYNHKCNELDGEIPDTGITIEYCNDDPIIDDIVWNTCICGMISFIMEHPSAALFANSRESICNILTGLMYDISDMDFDDNAPVNRLMSVAMGDTETTCTAYTEEISFCALLNKRTYDSILFTEYSINHGLSNHDQLEAGKRFMDYIMNCDDVHELQNIIHEICENREVPMPIRKLGFETISNVLVSKNQLYKLNRKAIYSMINKMRAVSNNLSCGKCLKPENRLNARIKCDVFMEFIKYRYKHDFIDDIPNYFDYYKHAELNLYDIMDMTKWM